MPRQSALHAVVRSISWSEMWRPRFREPAKHCIVPWIGSRYNYTHTELITESYFKYYVPHPALFWSYNTERRSFPADRPNSHRKHNAEGGKWTPNAYRQA